MGLVWSMLPAAPAGDSGGFRPASLEPLTLTIAAEVDGRTVASAAVERLLCAGDVVATDVQEQGIAGRLFLPSGAGPHLGVIVVGGSGGGLPAEQAAFIASHGFAVLALAYFNYADLPPVLVDIPLEYFEAAIGWLLARPEVAGEGVGVVGTSRGGELALLLGATFPAIRAMVALVPSHVRWGAVGKAGANSWTHHGKPLTIMPPSAGSAAAAASQRPEEQTAPIPLTPGFLAALEDDTAAAEAAIAVERINGPVLLVSGKDDAMWPSTLMAERALARLREHGHPYRDEHLAYADAGHTVSGLPGVPSAPLPSRHPVAGLVFAFGGTAAGVAAARQDVWPRILRFLHEAL
jgi:dienelactone hydrolase